MIAQKALTLILIIIVGTILNLTVIRILLRNVYKKSFPEMILKSSYKIEFSSIFIAASILFYKTILTCSEVVDSILKLNISNSGYEIIRTSAIYIGINLIGIIILYYLSIPICAIFSFNKKQTVEMNDDNTGYFTVKGLVILSLTFVSLPLLELINRLFIPSISTPLFF